MVEHNIQAQVEGRQLPVLVDKLVVVGILDRLGKLVVGMELELGTKICYLVNV